MYVHVHPMWVQAYMREGWKWGEESATAHGCLVRVGWFSHEVVSDSCDPVDYSLPGPSVIGILQPIILEWVVISFSRESSWFRNQTHVSYIGSQRIAGRFFINWTTREALVGKRESIQIVILPLEVSAYHI